MITVNIPGSKSITQRALICGAIANGKSVIKNPLLSEDTLLISNGIKKLGLKLEMQEKDIVVFGEGGKFYADNETIYMGNNGTGFRFLTTLSNFIDGTVILTGNERMKQRPVGNLVDALKKIGANIEYIEKEGFPPVKISGNSNLNNSISIDISKSSQFLSSLLLCAPLFKNGVKIFVKGKKVSKPYIDITVSVMKDFNVDVIEKDGFYEVAKEENYQRREFVVESDFSSASYFLAAAYFINKNILIKNLNYYKSLQGDKKFIDIVKKMGGKFDIKENQIKVIPEKLTGVTVDMSNVPDMVPTLAVLSAIAEGETVMENIEHLRYKETDRIETTVKNLVKCGIEAEAGEDFIKIKGSRKIVHAKIDPENDHRIAMSFALLSLITNNMEIMNKTCVKKSFPNFWDEFKKVQRS